MARALNDILRELDTVYNPQRDTINKSITALDPAQEAEQKGLEAAKTDAFSQITDQANRRGLFYSGIPVAEEQRYTGASFLPAVANLRSRYAQQRFNLQDALSKITENQYMKAYGIRQGEMDSEAAERAAAARGGGGDGFSPSLGGAPSVLGEQGGYGFQKRKDGGFNFVDPYGNSVSAATYAAATGTPFRKLLQMMAQQGDQGAKSALGFVGDDFGYDPRKVNSGNASLYNSLVWGTGRKLPVGVLAPAGGNRPGGNRLPALGSTPTQQAMRQISPVQQQSQLGTSYLNTLIRR